MTWPRGSRSAFRRVLLSMDARRRIGERARRALGVLKAFSIRLPGGPELSIDVDAVHGPADSGDLATDLSGLFVEVGEVARDHDLGVLLTVDELHYVAVPTLEALVMGLHRATQLRLPITVAAAGLPSLAALTGEAKSYAERMFTFPVIGSLRDPEAREALVLPADDEGVAWEETAAGPRLAADAGDPLLPSRVRPAGLERGRRPSHDHARRRRPECPGRHGRTGRRLLSVRTGRTSNPERAYLRAVAELGPGPVRSGDVAALLKKRSTALGPVRDGLLKKALCYSPCWGEIDFTVPMFGEFMKRWIPDLRSLG